MLTGKKRSMCPCAAGKSCCYYQMGDPDLIAALLSMESSKHPGKDIAV